MSVGKSNYACRSEVATKAASLTPRLRQWYEGTLTGNIEEISFAPDTKALRAMTVDDECAGKHCPLYAQCFYLRRPRRGIMMWL